MALTDYYDRQYQDTSALKPITGVDYSGIDFSGSGNWPRGRSGTYYAPGGKEAAARVQEYFGAIEPEVAAKYADAQDIGLLDMIRATGQSVLANNYFQTPGYQLLFGSDMRAMDPSLSPAERFESSPGYQYAMDETMRQVNRASAAQGLLESGRGIRNLTQTAQGLALQDYYNWWDRLSQNYENYQNRLAQLASAGMGMTGSQAALGTGQQQASATLGTGANIGGLLANQGTAGMGGMLNTGAAQASNIMNAAQINAQIEQANQQSMASAIGAGASLLGGLF